MPSCVGFLFPADFYLEAEVSLDEAEWLEEENIEAESQSIGLTICTPFPVSCKAGVAGLSNNSDLSKVLAPFAHFFNSLLVMCR